MNKITIEEAIKILTRWQDGNDITSFDDVNTAVKLGIEALKSIRDYRVLRGIDNLLPLPGETE